MTARGRAHTMTALRSGPRGSGLGRPGFNIKETLIAIVISFTMAFVFRGFVIEGFLIPTGSMAPTLLGKHMLFRDGDSGYEWTVGPWDYSGVSQGVPLPLQGTRERPVVVNDPMTGREIERAGEKLRAGDRLFVLKYLAGVYEPRRWDVVVFKAPHVEPQNYIKRLVGLPGEQVSLVDGDVFTTEPGRHVPTGPGAVQGNGLGAWSSGSWKIARKTERVQREVWQPVFDSERTPPPETQEQITPSERFRPPWSAGGPGWTGLRDSRSYRYDGSGTTELVWDHDRWPIDDYTPYNQVRASPQRYDREPVGSRAIFPVSDVAMRFGIEPEGDAAPAITARLNARGMQFRCVIGGSGASLEMRPAPAAGGDAPPWNVVDGVSSPDGPIIGAGGVTNVEFWHVDQALWLFVNGELLIGGPEAGAYELTPAERVLASTGRTLEQVYILRPDASVNPLGDTRLFRRPTARWSFEGGPFTLHRVGLDRDLHYQISPRRTLGGAPSLIAELTDEHFMLCGDNSANSLDARYWDAEYPWITETIHGGETHLGLVHRDLIIGRAFVVYLPSPFGRGWIPMLDVGRMRWIW